MYYLDSNVFILPVLYNGPRSLRALEFLEKTLKGDIRAATCTLTLDEVVYILTKRSSREIALRQAGKILNFPYLRILDVKKEDISLALGKMGRNERLYPRDAIHLSVALNNGFTNIVSDDDDFSRLEGIIHIPLSEDGDEVG